MFQLTSETYQEMEENYIGLCLGCQEEQDGCEPDARKYECQCCHENRVYGVPQLLIMGKIEIVD